MKLFQNIVVNFNRCNPLATCSLGAIACEATECGMSLVGTIGRGGIMIGNPAERLLPEVHRSVLAVKPPEFQCPVQLD
jgi:hypothetical protein